MAHGRYTIVGKLADGGMAEIFLAMQHGAEGFQKPVALKRVLTAFSADQQFRNMFLDEAHISMSLSHGNIVQVLDVGVAGERTFLVLELVEGWDLGQILERAQATGPEHPWPPSLALYVTAEICRGLAYAHAKRGPDGRALGIVHRDVSPNNVLISEQGEVKLADFGIAKAEKKREQTLAGVIKGKIGFMSPEQALGRALDARADLFSVGAVMYLMLTGRRPFDAGSELESMMKAQRAEYRPPEELNPYLSPGATAIVGRAMQREPPARYQTADEMLVDLERVLRGEYHSAGQTELKRWLTDLARRDGVAPIGRVPTPVEGDPRPIFVDDHGDLSAGSSVELSDFQRSSATTAVAAPPGSPGMPTAHPSTPAAFAASLSATASPNSSPNLASKIGRSAAEFSAPTERRFGVATLVDPGPAAGPTPSPSSPFTSPSLPPSASPSPSGPGSAVPSAATALSPSAPTSARPPGPSASSSSVAALRLPRRSRVGLGFILGALCMLGCVYGIKWLAQWAGREHIAVPLWERVSGDAPMVATTPSASPSPAPADSDSAPGDAAASSPSSPQGNAGVADSSDGLAVREQSDKAAAGARAGLGQAPELDDDEDRLLGRVVPDASAVIGEDEAEAPKGGAKSAKKESTGTKDESKSPTVSAAPGDTPPGPGQPPESGKASALTPDPDGERARAPSGPRGQPKSTARPASPVQVRITTSPLGAVVKTKKQVLGRTPLAVRFNPGNTYELTFVKRGYVTHSRRLAVASGKPKNVSVAMKKKPPQRRGFFGGR